MTIEHSETNNKGQFSAIEEDKLAGIMTYSRVNEHKIIIDHTEVNPGFEGKGVGKKLVICAVAYARDNRQEILPLCPFAKSVFEKIESIRDVLYKPNI